MNCIGFQCNMPHKLLSTPQHKRTLAVLFHFSKIFFISDVHSHFASLLFFVTFPFGTQFTHTFSLSQNDLYTNRGLLQSILNLDCNAFSEFVGYFENVKLPLQAANYFGIQIEIAVPCSFRLRVIR